MTATTTATRLTRNTFHLSARGGADTDRWMPLLRAAAERAEDAEESLRAAMGEIGELRASLARERSRSRALRIRLRFWRHAGYLVTGIAAVLTLALIALARG